MRNIVLKTIMIPVWVLILLYCSRIVSRVILLDYSGEWWEVVFRIYNAVIETGRGDIGFVILIGYGLALLYSFVIFIVSLFWTEEEEYEEWE